MMIKMKFLIIFAAIFVLHSTNGQKASTTSTTPIPTTSYPHATDPYVGGKAGNPGAKIHLSSKALDQLCSFVADQLGRRIKLMNVSDYELTVDGGKLMFKSVRFTESKFGKYEKQLSPPNRINSKFHDGKFTIEGDWAYKPSTTTSGGKASSGTFKTTIKNAVLESIVQLLRSKDLKPTVEMVECKTNFSEYKVDVKGAKGLTKIEKCKNATCNQVQKYVEDATCQEFQSFIKDIIDTRLATFPAMIELYPNEYSINYGLLVDEPKVTNFDIQGGLEGKAVWYGQSNVPFHPQQLDFDNRTNMIMFELGDYAFNTLLHQVHAKGYKYSAADLLSKSPSINDSLLLNCSTSTGKGIYKNGGKHHRAGSFGIHRGSCLGSILENITNFDQQQLGSLEEIGDLVFKSVNRAPAIIISKHKRATRWWCNGRAFNSSDGVLELYGTVVDKNHQRKLLAKADVRSMIGDFNAKLNKTNITGTIKINKLELTQSESQRRSLGEEWLVRLQEFAIPLLTDMFNAFFERYGQFPLPMLDGFECMTPQLSIMDRSVQVSCDIKALTRATTGSSRCSYGFYDTYGNYYWYDCASQCWYSYAHGYWCCPDADGYYDWCWWSGKKNVKAGRW